MTPNHSTYRDNRHIGAGRPREDEGGVGAGWRPRLGAAITLFGSEVTVGPEHVLVLVTIGVLGGVEVRPSQRLHTLRQQHRAPRLQPCVSQAAIATVVLFLGYLYLKANPIVPADAAGRAGRPARRRAAPSHRVAASVT